MNRTVYLHIGNDFSVDVRDIVGIFDIENTTVGSCTKSLLDRSEKEHRCVYTTYEMPKSFIITVKNGSEKVFISQLSAATLRKRLDNGGF